VAIYIEYVDVIVPITIMERCSAIGGFDTFIHRHKGDDFPMVWHDEHLCRVDGSMSTGDIESMIKRWERKGFRPFVGEGDGRVWGDLCVVVATRGPFGLPCDWITVDESRSWAWLTGYPEGERIGPTRAFQQGR
jgi:hypothetical protein